MIPEKARRHGYRAKATGENRCRTCSFGGVATMKGTVWCSMFRFYAKAEGVCNAWAPERKVKRR